MNKRIIYTLLAIILVASCRRDDDNVFDKSPDERLNETLKQYQTALVSSPNGWNANLTTGDGSTFRFYFSFNDQNRVQMYSDFDATTASASRESSYRLKALQQPSLIFDTYSYIHLLSDPDGAVNGGTYGQGLRSDFEFAVDTVTADSIRLTGRFNGSRLTLRKASQSDKEIWSTNQVLNGIVNFRNIQKINLYFKKLNFAGNDYELQFDTTARQVKISWTSGGQTQTVTRSYYFWANGVYFSEPIVDGSTTIPGFTITGFNAGSQTMNVTVNGLNGTIRGDKFPINPDVINASNRWWQRSGSGDNYWVSFDGWHVNGVNDAYNIKSLKNDTADFYYLLYKGNTNGADAFFTIYLDEAEGVIDVEHGSWVGMNINTANGIARFSQLALRDPAVPWPATGPAAQTVNQMYNSNGFYFVQSSPFSYDQVSVNDPRIWITWYWIW